MIAIGMTPLVSSMYLILKASIILLLVLFFVYPTATSSLLRTSSFAYAPTDAPSRNDNDNKIDTITSIGRNGLHSNKHILNSAEVLLGLQRRFLHSALQKTKTLQYEKSEKAKEPVTFKVPHTIGLEPIARGLAHDEEQTVRVQQGIKVKDLSKSNDLDDTKTFIQASPHSHPDLTLKEQLLYNSLSREHFDFDAFVMADASQRWQRNCLRIHRSKQICKTLKSAAQCFQQLLRSPSDAVTTANGKNFLTPPPPTTIEQEHASNKCSQVSPKPYCYYVQEEMEKYLQRVQKPHSGDLPALPKTVLRPRSLQNFTTTCDSVQHTSSTAPTIEERMSNSCARKGKITRTWVDSMLPPAECARYPHGSSDRNRCLYVSDIQSPMVIVVYIALALTGTCLVALLLLACIRQRQRDRAPMLGPSVLPDGNILPKYPGDTGHDTFSYRRYAGDEIAPNMTMTLDGANDGWSKWMRGNGNKRKRGLVPVTRASAPRLPSLKLPKPSLATVRRTSGLEPDNYNRYKSRASVATTRILRWGSNN